MSFIASNGCPDCTAACLRMKAQGFREWRDQFACFECAAVNIDEWMAKNGIVESDLLPQSGDQLDMFGSAA